MNSAKVLTAIQSTLAETELHISWPNFAREEKKFDYPKIREEKNLNDLTHIKKIRHNPNPAAASVGIFFAFLLAEEKSLFISQL